MFNIRTMKKVKISDEEIFFNKEKVKVEVIEDWLGYLNTRVVLQDGITGTTWIKPNDEYDKETGILVAYLKAKNKQDMKIIKEIQQDINDRVKILRKI